MYIHLKEREYYENLYDSMTVEAARRSIKYYDNFYADFKKKLPKGEKIDRPGNAFVLNVFYMETLGNELLRRYENRNDKINEWIDRDEEKDAQIAHARLQEEPNCQHCHKQGLRIIDKSLLHKKEGAKHDDPEEVLFMLKCPHCDKNSAFWEDGTTWKVKPTTCPKCSTEMTHKSRRSKLAVTITYTCPDCSHSYKDLIDLRNKEEKTDPDYDKDRAHYCLQDKEFRERLFSMRRDFREMARLGKEMQERRDNQHVYDAVKEIKKPKIAELIPLLSEPLEKAGYIEFHLDKPEMGRDVYVGFSCLDSKSERDDDESRKTLKKLVDSALEDTNWRLMSDGISYRLGYLNGRVRAYEGEEDLKNLVIKSKKLKPKRISRSKADNAYRIKDKDGREIIL